MSVVAYYALTDHFTIYRYVEPFWMYAPGSVVLWTMLATLLLATLVVRNLYCRFLCPVGAMLGIISQATTLLRIKRWSECKTCPHLRAHLRVGRDSWSADRALGMRSLRRL